MCFLSALQELLVAAVVDDIAAECRGSNKKVDTGERQETNRNPKVARVHKQVPRVHAERCY